MNTCVYLYALAGNTIALFLPYTSVLLMVFNYFKLIIIYQNILFLLNLRVLCRLDCFSSYIKGFHKMETLLFSFVVSIKVIWNFNPMVRLYKQQESETFYFLYISILNIPSIKFRFIRRSSYRIDTTDT